MVEKLWPHFDNMTDNNVRGYLIQHSHLENMNLGMSRIHIQS